MSQILNVDVAVVGAGPAGLFLAQEAKRLAPELSILILDAGNPSKKRHCPLMVSGECSECNVCHVVYGSGGAGMFSDGKISSYPAGSGLAEVLGSSDAASKLSDDVTTTFERLLSGVSYDNSSICDSCNPTLREIKDSGLSLKEYSVKHVGSEGIQIACNRLREELLASGVSIVYRHKVQSLEKVQGGFCMRGTSNGSQFSIKAKTVVACPGKAAGLLLRTFLNELGVSYKYNPIEIGVRVETASERMLHFTSTCLDAKLKTKVGDDEVRTFCMCSGGFITKCFYEDYLPTERICTLSGYSLMGRKSSNSNFGILVRHNYPENVDPIYEQMPIIQAINRLPGRTVVQRLDDFISNKTTTSSRLNEGAVRTTLDVCTPANLKEMLPTFVTKSIESFLGKLQQVSPLNLPGDTLLHAPMWELCWDRIIVNERMETSVPGFYVAGDAMGAARGIVQAGMSGVQIARTIVENVRGIFEVNVNTKRYCSESL